MDEQNSWIYKDKELVEIPEGFIGFIYLITCLTTNKKYIGKKGFRFARTKIKTVILKNGTKKKKKIKAPIDSDWLDYYGSSDWLKEDIEKLGKNNFKREILYLCKSKAEMSYRESYEIFSNHALLKEDYYNSWCKVTVHRTHVFNKIDFKEN